MVRDYSENFCIRGHLLRSSQYGFFLGKQTNSCSVMSDQVRGMDGWASKPGSRDGGAGGLFGWWRFGGGRGGS